MKVSNIMYEMWLPISQDENDGVKKDEQTIHDRSQFFFFANSYQKTYEGYKMKQRGPTFRYSNDWY